MWRGGQISMLPVDSKCAAGGVYTQSTEAFLEDQAANGRWSDKTRQYRDGRGCQHTLMREGVECKD